MSTVAEQLRAGREARNLTVEQVAEATKIRTDHVRALEEGDFGAFSATVYIRGSVKIYSKFLKLDEAALLALLDGQLKATDKFSEPPPLVEQKKTIIDHAALAFAKLNWKMGFAGIGAVILVVILGVAFLTWKHHKQNDPLANLPPAVYQPTGSGDTLPLPKK
ncbi:MAG TPA: helix-turn-helix domain-containing protein [Verrucomicrobiae bacterium]|nr:helix-turn-helix domain-containing protein [Verrucomicrobiae bacterium]